MFYVLLGVGQLLCSWNGDHIRGLFLHDHIRGLFLYDHSHDFIGSYRPNRVHWIFCRCGEIPKGLAVLKPLLFLFGGGVGERDEDDYCGGSGQFTFTGKKSSSYVIPVIGMSRN